MLPPLLLSRVAPPVAVLATLCALAATAMAGDGGVGVGGGGVGGGGDDTGSGAGHTFPLPVKHEYGDGYGAGRGHEGQDVFAKCGKPIVSARAGKVKYNERDSGAGNYIVINGKGTKRDYMYAHMKRKPRFKRGDRIDKGQQIGAVGDSGNASGCHLHFELWRGDWNGRPDVTRKLKRWDRRS
jgi:murein DD-endopeptidase MepM/ murein hydrolase activator NlpD